MQFFFFFFVSFFFNYCEAYRRWNLTIVLLSVLVPCLSIPCTSLWSVLAMSHLWAMLLWSPPIQWHIHCMFFSPSSGNLELWHKPLSLRLHGCCSWCMFALSRNLEENKESRDWESSGFKVKHRHIWNVMWDVMWVFLLGPVFLVYQAQDEMPHNRWKSAFSCFLDAIQHCNINASNSQILLSLFAIFCHQYTACITYSR